MSQLFSGTGGRVIDPDHMGEVSRGHIRRNETDVRRVRTDELGTRTVIERAGAGNSRPKRVVLDVEQPSEGPNGMSGQRKWISHEQ